ncbi:MAG: phosphatidylglycerol lysyltransferase domain-containing protein, partial [Nitrospira sp.]|nr:phosphatidylglycerol lysyltransferase domain-containing protein [Nitrospira sp.]
PMGIRISEPSPFTVSPKTLPQFVPGSACSRCDVCCRFPSADSFLRPYFTDQEIIEAERRGLCRDYFPDRSGSQVNLVRDPQGEGYVCPAFDTVSARCRIYEARPLDCRLYPLALMWDEAHEQVVLGWDTKCPYLRETIPADIAAYAEQVARWLEAEPYLETIAAHSRLVGPFQDDVVVVRSLPLLTARLSGAKAAVPFLRMLTPADAPRLAQSLESSGFLRADALAAYAFPYHYIWTGRLPYRWMESSGTLFLFAESPDGWFMPLPPLGSRSLEETVDLAFELMRRWNGLSPANRIENVMAPQKSLLERKGLRCRQKEGDYLYRAAPLAMLRGGNYRSQRALCNRVEREYPVRARLYQEKDEPGCLALLSRWVEQKRAGFLDEAASLFLEDAISAHTLALAEYERIGLSGTVAVSKDETIMAYTFGYWLTPSTWCVLLEVADRSIPGLGQWLFRETCREVVAQGAVFINAMDDAGLPGLRAAKRHYHPTMLVENWIVAEPET